MDVARNTDERSSGLCRLDHQAGPNANASAVFRFDILGALRRDPVPVTGRGRHPETVTKAHAQRFLGRRVVHNRGPASAKDFRNDHVIIIIITIIKDGSRIKKCGFEPTFLMYFSTSSYL